MADTIITIRIGAELAAKASQLQWTAHATGSSKTGFGNMWKLRSGRLRVSKEAITSLENGEGIPHPA